MNRLDEAHATCLNILNDNKDSAPRVAELCRFARSLGGEIDDLHTERDELKRRCEDLAALIAPNMSASLAARCLAIAEGRDNG